MKPGKELDAFIQEKILGYISETLVPPAYSTNLGVAYDYLVNDISKRGGVLRLIIWTNRTCFASAMGLIKHDGLSLLAQEFEGETAAHAICKLYLHAMGVKGFEPMPREGIPRGEIRR